MAASIAIAIARCPSRDARLPIMELIDEIAWRRAVGERKTVARNAQPTQMAQAA